MGIGVIERVMRRWDLLVAGVVILSPSLTFVAYLFLTWDMSAQQRELIVLLDGIAAASSRENEDPRDFATDAGVALSALAARPLSNGALAHIRTVLAGEVPPWELDHGVRDELLARHADFSTVLKASTTTASGAPLSEVALVGLEGVGEQLALAALEARSRGRDQPADALCVVGYELTDLIAGGGGFDQARAAQGVWEPLHQTCAETLGTGSRADRLLHIAYLRARRDAVPGIADVVRTDRALRELMLHLRVLGRLPDTLRAHLPNGWSPGDANTEPIDGLLEQVVGRHAWRELSVFMREQEVAARTGAARSPPVIPGGPTKNVAANLNALREATDRWLSERRLATSLLIGRMASEVFFSAHGRWPTNLDELAEGDPLLKSDLSDPISGRSFFLLSHEPWLSVGADGGVIRASPPQ